MRARNPVLPLIVVTTLLAAALGWFVFFGQAPSPGARSFDLQLAQMRAAARESGPLPLRLNALVVGRGVFPSVAVVAGDRITRKTAMVFSAFQVVYADRTIIIDTVHDRSLHEKFFAGEPFYPEAFAKLQQALRKSSMILVTHEHMDHVGGISRSPYLEEILPKVAMTPEQIHGPTTIAADWPEGARQRLKPLEYEGVHSPAPGIALLKAAGHSLGSQLIYRTLADGREFLFVGDIAWNMANVERVRGRPLFISQFMLQEDRQACVDQLQALHRLAEESPGKPQLLVAHDEQQLEAMFQNGSIGNSFEDL